MPKHYRKAHEKAQIVIDYLETNPKSTAKQIVKGTGLAQATVYQTLLDLDDLLEKKSIKTSHFHRAMVYSLSNDDSQKVVIKKATSSIKPALRHDPITAALFGMRV